MPYTLISSMGTGMYKKEGGYRKTTYEFPDGRRCETNLFLKALLETRYRDIGKIILVGTATSAWDMLLEDEQELWGKVFEAREAKAMTDDLFKQMEAHLSERFQMPVIIKHHSDIISDETAEQIFAIYNSIAPELQSESVLFDITHGFRSMPILLYQALQYSLTGGGAVKNVELVYGEYIDEEKVSRVRDLSQYWKFSQVASSVSVFNEKLDGFKLTDLISDIWPEGAKAIKKISETAQTNFALQIGEAIRSVKNALEKYPKNAPSHLDKVKEALERLLPLYDENSQAQTLYNYSRLLYEKKLNVQAVITLQVAVETAIAEKYGGNDAIGNYDWWREAGKQHLQELKAGDEKLSRWLGNLERFRNQIAHGGAKNRGGGFPSAENIPNIYKSGKEGCELLFRKISGKQR